jgi:hypothetical protein
MNNEKFGMLSGNQIRRLIKKEGSLSPVQKLTYGFHAKGCYTDNYRGLTSYMENHIYTVRQEMSESMTTNEHKEPQKGSVEVEAETREEARNIAVPEMHPNAKITTLRVIENPRNGFLGLGKRLGRYRVYFKVEAEPGTARKPAECRLEAAVRKPNDAPQVADAQSSYEDAETQFDGATKAAQEAENLIGRLIDELVEVGRSEGFLISSKDNKCCNNCGSRIKIARNKRTCPVCGLMENYSHFDKNGKNKRARRIGIILNDIGGMKLMQTSCREVRTELGASQGRKLEGAWGYIGSWLP